MSPERYHQIGNALVRAASLDVPTHEDGDTLGELLSDAAPEPEYEPPAKFAKIMDALEGLPEKDRSLILLRYGLADNHSHTFIEIAKMQGVSRNAVMERQVRIERRLRESLGAA
jgi:RNA polymerase primary sigma factor